MFFEMKNKGRMQIFKKQKVVLGPRDYQENVRRSKLCRVDTRSKPKGFMNRGLMNSKCS